MKCLEIIVKSHVLSATQKLLDPFQFAYQPSRGVDDAILTLLNMVLGFGLSRELFLATVLLHLHCLLFGVLGWVSLQH